MGPLDISLTELRVRLQTFGSARDTRMKSIYNQGNCCNTSLKGQFYNNYQALRTEAMSRSQNVPTIYRGNFGIDITSLCIVYYHFFLF